MNSLTMDTQTCIVLVLVLLIALVSGAIGWHMGWVRCVEYIESLNFSHITTEGRRNGEAADDKV